MIEIAANELHDQGAMTRHFRKLARYLGMSETRRRLRDDPSWFHEREESEADQPSPLRLVSPAPEDRYVTCVPLIPLHLAAGEFGNPDTYAEESECAWVALDTGRSLRHGMFVARVDGKSMEPRIPDGSYCLFAGPVTGTRQGRVVLAKMLNALDPDTGQRFTVKRYQSEKATNEDGWRHLSIFLEPINPEYEPIKLTGEDESPVAVVAELIEVIGTDPPIE